MSTTKVTSSRYLFELKLNFHIISSPKQFSRGLQMFISIHTRMKFLEDGASGSIKIKYGFKSEKNEIFSRWNFRFHQNQIRLKVVKKMKFLWDKTSGSIKHGFRPNLYYVELQVHQIWLQAIKIEIFFTRWNFRFHQNQIRLWAVNKNWNYRFHRDDFRSSLYWNGRFHKKTKYKR